MKILDRNFASGLVSGIASLFAVFSVLIMNPEQMWRWLFHTDPSEKKVERALSKPAELILSLEDQLKDLQNTALLQDRNAQERETILINEKKRLEAALKKTSSENINTKTKLKEKELEINRLREKVASSEGSCSENMKRAVNGAPSGLSGTAVTLEFADTLARKAFQMKTELEKADVNVQMISRGYNVSKFDHKTIYYKEESDLGLALKLLEFLSKYGYEKVEKSIHVNRTVKFAFGIWR